MTELKNIKSPDQKELKQFGTILAGFIIVAPLIFSYVFSHPYLWKIIFPSAAFVFFISQTTPKFLKIIYLPWMSVAKRIGWLNTYLIMGIFYWVIFSPFAFLARKFKMPLDLSLDARKSYFVLSKKNKSDMKRTY